MIIRSINEGGQTAAHKVRMFRQVLRISMFCGLTVSVLFFSSRLLLLPGPIFSGSWEVVKAVAMEKCMLSDAKIPGWVLSQVDEKRNWDPGRSYFVKQGRPAILIYKDFWIAFFSKEGGVAKNIFFGTTGSSLCLFGLYGIARRRTKHIRGRKKRSSLAKRIFPKISNNLHIGQVPLVKGSETQHIMISGGTGSGKTNCLKSILKQLKEKKVIVVDPTNCLKEKFFNKERADVLLNPLDEQSVCWNIWEECDDDEKIDSFSEALIPVSHNPDAEFWRTGSRTIVAELLKAHRKKGKISALCDSLLHEKSANLFELLEETPAGRFLDPSGDRTTASMLMEATRWLKAMVHLKDGPSEFLIKNWMRNESGWLFLSCTPSQRSQTKDLLRAWLNWTTRTLMDLEPNLKRRIWFAIDELPALDRVQGLETLLAEGRKYGACATLCFQSPSQLDEIYGRSAKKSIVSNCATKVVFREGDPQNAKELSGCIGEMEIEEHQEGISYGAHEMRDGVSISKRKIVRPCVSADEIMRLKPNHGFLSLPDNQPIEKIKIRY